jgi:hypothetical protein
VDKVESSPIYTGGIWLCKLCVLFCAATERGRSYCLLVTDGINCLTASLACNRGWDKDTTEKLERELFPLKYQRVFGTGVI